MKLLILLVVGYFCYRGLKKWLMMGSQPSESVSSGTRGEIDGVMIQDPVCGVYFSKENAISTHVNGEKFYFCSQECKNEFIQKRKQS